MGECAVVCMCHSVAHVVARPTFLFSHFMPSTKNFHHALHERRHTQDRQRLSVRMCAQQLHLHFLPRQMIPQLHLHHLLSTFATNGCAKTVLGFTRCVGEKSGGTYGLRRVGTWVSCCSCTVEAQENMDEVDIRECDWHGGQTNKTARHGQPRSSTACVKKNRWV